MAEDDAGGRAPSAVAHLARRTAYELFMIVDPRVDPAARRFVARDVTQFAVQSTYEARGYLYEERGEERGEKEEGRPEK